MESAAVPKIMLVEDDISLALVVRDYLQEFGYSVSIENSGDIAAKRILKDELDAVILDVALPGMDGFEICRRVRTAYSGVIIMLTARSEDVDEVLGLEVGADDYLSKPVRPAVLLTRLNLHLRRKSADNVQPDELLELGNLKIYPQRRVVVLRDEPLQLSVAEFEVLLILARTPGKPVQRADIFQQINPHEVFNYRDRSIDLRISRLRRKLHDDPMKPTRILSIRGNGYMIVEES